MIFSAQLVLYFSLMKSIFELELWKQGFLFQETFDGYYNIKIRNRIVLPTKVQLVISKSIDLIYHGSQNGNEIDAIGYFHFPLNSDHPPDYMVFSFLHMRNNSNQYMIIPTIELRKRQEKNLIRYRTGEYLELRLWLMDSHIYDTTNMGLEAEWYYLSKGRNGRTIDGTCWNYTKFLNNWAMDRSDV